MDTLATSQFSYKVIRLHVPHAIQLIAVINKQKRLMFCSSQVYYVCLPDTCSYTHFIQAVKMISKSPLHLALGADKVLLTRLGALSCKANHASLISVSVVCSALKACHADAAVFGAFDNIRKEPTKLTVLPLPSHVLQPCAKPSPNPPGLQLLDPLPVTLPPYELPQRILKRYGLQTTKPDLFRLAPLSQHLEELRSWCMNPIQLDRLAMAHGSRTWENTLDNVQLFLGFCFHYEHIMQPTLQHYLSPDLLSKYVSHRLALQHSSLTIKHALATAAVVLKWWQTKPGGHDPSLAKGLQWIQVLSIQVRH